MASATPAAPAAGLLEELGEALPETEFRAPLLQELQAACQGSVGEAASRLLLAWFGEAGLVVVEPHVVRGGGADVLVRALQEPEAVREAIDADTAALRELGYEAPLPVPEAGRTLVYHVDEAGTRHRLRREAGGDLVAEDAELRLAASEAAEAVRSAPERFSPAAALRPVVQAACLPVAAYVAGGGELAYHVQLRKLFALCGERLPLLAPRAAGTILKSSASKAMAKIGLEVEDLLSPGWEWETIAAQGTEHGRQREAAFARARERVEEAIAGLKEELHGAGVSGLREVDRERDRFFGRLEGLARRFEAQDPLVGEAARKRYFRLRKYVLPGESYQELTVWSVYFLALFGPELLERLRAELDPFTEQHHVFLVR
jgi:uncharacterized protein YllA (UPF0747 family)